MTQVLSHVIGFDDAPFRSEHRGDVPLVGAVFSHMRLEGVLTGKVRRDGVNSTSRIEQMVTQSRFAPQLQAVLIQGIAVAGFNVIDIHALNQRLNLPVIVVSRKLPDMEAIKEALLNNVPGGRRKWQLIEQAGPMELVAKVYIQRAGISLGTAEALIRSCAKNSHIPEPLRTAHLIAAGLVNSNSRQRV
ncbi:DUF99 family protein [Pseudomonadota bacterium]